MSYIAPNSTVVVCSGVPLDNGYKDTIYFSSASAQRSYFSGKAKYSYSDQYYQRVGKGTIRVEQCADDLYDCNYMYFINTSFGSKRFYAFITAVEYVNNITAEITYEIDVLQTWHFDYSVGKCFVEREHVTDDSIGANVVSEPVDIGDIKCVDVTKSGYCDDYYAIVATGYDEDDNTPGGLYAGIPSGLNYRRFNASDETALTTLWDYLQDAVDNEKDDAIVAIWMQPKSFTTLGTSASSTASTKIMRMPSDVSGYTPKNNKLFTYPYNYICVDTGTDLGTYRYEWFNDPNSYNGSYAFTMYGSTCPTPEVICEPEYYNGSTLLNSTEAVILKDFPQIAWASDAYRAWVASGGYASTLFSVTGGAVMTAAGVATGNPLLTSSGILGIGNATVNAIRDANKGATGHGTQSGSILSALGEKDFYFKQMQVQYDYAESIDNFFTKYGYQINKLKVPSRNGREGWNYVKTKDACILSESVPAEDTKKISSIYDAGVTFWMSGSGVGNYSGDNDIA